MSSPSKRADVIVLLLCLFAVACGPEGSVPDRSPGVSWDLAQHRASTLSDIRYELALTIPESKDQPIVGVEIIRFDRSKDGGDLVIDFMPGSEQVTDVQVAGESVTYTVLNEHIIIPESVMQTGENSVHVEFIAGNSALNRNDEFLYTLFVPDRAHFAIPCFDQPNLKARVTLTLTVPISWKAVANGPWAQRTQTDSSATYTFQETYPISTYLIAFAAGRFDTETAERGGRTMTMYHRETDAEKVRRNRETIFDLHETALNWLETYTNIPYPFKKFDFVLIPSFQYGGMEHPGAIFYRDTGILHDEVATQNQELGRAGLIAHETAHMWFGDLVTMNWFDDVWTKEVFANFMSDKIVNPSFPEVNHDLRFLSHYPAAYAVDRTGGANPIRQPLENLNMAGTLYGNIIYQKAPIVMKHLELLVGEETFRQGMRTYLSTYQFGNATWPNLIDILDGLSDEDLKTWSQVWVEEPGRPTVEMKIDANEQHVIQELSLVQSDPAENSRHWTQRLTLALAYPESTRTIDVKLYASRVTVGSAAGLPVPDYVLPNGGGVGYGLFRLDPASRSFLLEQLPHITDPMHRGIAWITLREEMLEGDVSAEDLLTLGLQALATETDQLIIQRIIGTINSAYWRFIASDIRRQWAPRLERIFREKLDQARTTSLRATYFNGFRSVVLSESGLGYLKSVWQQEQSIRGLRFAEPDYIGMAQLLALRDLPDAEEILDAQRERIENPDRLARYDFVRPALSADQQTRDDFFASLADEGNRAREPWVLEGLRYLHHPLRAPMSESYILPSLELVEEIQRTGDIFFPKGWLDATLGGHQSVSAAAVVTRFFEDHPDFPARLRAKILQAADGLFRAAAIAEAQ